MSKSLMTKRPGVLVRFVPFVATICPDFSVAGGDNYILPQNDKLDIGNRVSHVEAVGGPRRGPLASSVRVSVKESMKDPVKDSVQKPVKEPF
jgi:hypothetical protein